MIQSARFLFLLFAAVALFATGCDTTGTTAGNGGSGGTILINKDNQSGGSVPRFEFTFEYGQGDIVNGTVVETSANTDDIGGLLSRVAAADRSDVIAARVDSVVLRRVSTPGTGLQGEITPTSPQAKVFDYLGGADVFFGSDTNAPRIAQSDFQSSDLTLELDVDTRTVTSIVQQGARPMTLELTVEDPDTVSSTERVSVTVWFELEIRAE